MQRDPYKFFRIEARELIDQLGKAALDLESGANPPEALARLLRLAHTLKGAARVVKQPAMADHAHAVEGALAPHRDGSGVPRETVDQALKLIDEMGQQLARLPAATKATEPAAEAPSKPEPAPKASAAPKPEAQALPAAGSLAVAVPEIVRTVRTDINDVDVLLQGFAELRGELLAIRSAMAGMGEARQSVAVVAELEHMLSGREREMTGSVDRAERELGELRALAERLRLSPAAALFNTLERLARDAARAAGKSVEFEARGGEVRMDGHVLDTVQPALMQLVRNAVAHGIEPGIERRALGKREAGKVTLEVVRNGQRAVFRCRDDGRGIDLDAVERALRASGGIAAGAPRPDDAQLLRQLLRGGVSTASVVTDLSGRGIGLDVVHEAAQRLRGELAVDTAPGKGTTIELSVPLSLASFEALVVEAGGTSAALPLEAVAGVRRVGRADVAMAATGEAIAYEDGLVPLVRLAGELAALPRDRVPATRRNGEAFTAILMRPVKDAAADRLVAVAVDRLAGVETVLFRPLPELAPVAAVVAGLYLDGEGNPRAVLAPDALAQAAGRADAREDGEEVARLPILVIDDSLTTRMLEQSILESAGYAVQLAVSAEEGLEMAQRVDYGLILCDVEMPGMDGFTFVERSRADPRLREVPCMLVTSRNSVEDRRRAEAAGASGYIVKGDFDQVHFLARVAQLAIA